MTTNESTTDATPTLSLEAFWSWLVTHPNCIVRAGTREAVIYDDEDLHWHLADEGPETLLVQLIRGKRLVGEMLIPSEGIAFVQGVIGDQDGEYVFELVPEGESDGSAVYFFVMAHGYDVQEPLDSHRMH